MAVGPIPVQAETRWAYIPEVTPGTTPATPAFNIIRPRAGSTLKINRPRNESTELQPNRRLGSTFAGIGGASGALQTLLFHEAFQHDLLQTALCGTWSSDVLVDGITPNYLSFERKFVSGSGGIYQRSEGTLIDKFAMSVIPSQEVTVNYALVGLAGVSDSAIITGATYVAPAAGESADYTDITPVSIFGLTGYSLCRIDLNINNNLAGQEKLGSKDLAGIRLGKDRITGTIEMYLQDAAYLAAAIANTTAALSFTIGPAKTSGAQYTFTIPKAEIIDHNADDTTGDGIIQFMFTAKNDTGSGSAISVTRNV